MNDGFPERRLNWKRLPETEDGLSEVVWLRGRVLNLRR